MATLKIKEGASVLGAELTESVAVSPLESDVYVSFIIPIVTVLLVSEGVTESREVCIAKSEYVHPD